MENTKEKNVRLYPIYQIVSWDLLFFYSISLLFCMQEKGMSAADVVLAEAFYPIFKFIFLVPATALVEKIGKRKSLILANFANAICIFCYITATGAVQSIILAQCFSAIAFVIKGIAESNMLYDSLPKTEKRGKIFSKVEGKGVSWYYYADAATALVTGFLYVANHYIPMVLSLICCLISTYISYCFIEVEDTKVAKRITLKSYAKDLKQSFRYMFQSNRLRYLLLLGGIFVGSFAMMSTLRSSVLEQIGVPEQYFGVIFAVLGMIAGISAKNQDRIHNHFRNKTLGALSVPYAISAIVVGFLVALKMPFGITLACILIMYLIQFVTRGPASTLVKRYLNNFTNSSIRTKISSSYNMLSSLIGSLLTLLSSFLLRIMKPSVTMMVIGCLLTIMIVLLLDKMRKRVGLKPEQYDKKEVEFLELK